MIGFQLRTTALGLDSEKHADHIFIEAEKAADDDGASDVVDLPDTGLPLRRKQDGKEARPQTASRKPAARAHGV